MTYFEFKITLEDQGENWVATLAAPNNYSGYGESPTEALINIGLKVEEILERPHSDNSEDADLKRILDDIEKSLEQMERKFAKIK